MTNDTLYAIAEDDGIPIVPFSLGRIEAMSYMSSKGKFYIAIDPERIKSKQDEKIKLSHELGHCVTGSFYNVYATCDVWKKHENRANKNSVQRLVPKDELDEAVSAGFTESWQLAEYFDVPVDFMKMACHWYKHHNMDLAAQGGL